MNTRTLIPLTAVISVLLTVVYLVLFDSRRTPQNSDKQCGAPLTNSVQAAEKPYEIKELAHGSAISITVTGPDICRYDTDEILKAWESAIKEVLQKYVVVSSLPIATTCFTTEHSVTQEIILFVKPLPAEDPIQ